LRDLAFYNAVLAGFNLLPFLPLDGGRLFQLFLGNRLGILRANRLLLLVGRVAAVLVILLGFVQITLFHFNATLLCAGIFLWRKQKNLRVGLRMECFLTLQKKPAVLRGQRGRGRFKVKPLAVPVDMPVLKAVERLTWSHVKDFTIDGQSLREEKLLAFIFSPDRPSISASLTMPIGAVI
jgi:stage IV sporulation protein FB